MSLDKGVFYKEEAFRMVDHIEVIHGNKAHFLVQSSHINNSERLGQGMEDRALHQDDNCGLGSEHDRKGWDGHMDEGSWEV